MKKIFVALLTAALAAGHGNAENAVILKQTAAPLVITQYTASFRQEFRGSAGNIYPSNITHAATVKNTSTKEIVALQIGFAAFDAFNAFMDSFSGWNIESVGVNGEIKDSWSHQPYANFAFQKYGTGVAYVKAVRFADGTIWRADMVEILVEMQKFEKSLKKEDLEEKKK
jgi:hypothetical protein